MICFLLIFLAFNITPSSAQEGERVKATIVIASNEGADFDLDNDRYRDEMIKLFSYSNYHQLDSQAVELKKGDRSRITLPDGHELWLTLQRGEKDRIWVQAVIRKGNQQVLDTVLSLLRPGGTVFLGGPQVEQGVLIIVLESGF